MQDLVPTPAEPRSWEPQPVKFEPITSSRPTNAQLGKGVDQLHTCLESHRQHTARELGAIRRDIKDLKGALGVGEVKKKTLATQTEGAAWWRTFAATGGAIAAAGVILRMSEVLWPWLKGASVAIYHAMLAGRL